MERLISYTVTFKVVNGKWNEGEDDAATADKTVTLTGHDGDTLKLTADQIPAVGSKPNDTYKAGSWDTTPSTETEITAATTYTYTYAQKSSISQTVTFKVVNGSWDDETTTDKTVTLTGYEGDTLKLAANQIPSVGTKPNDTYKAGSWDTTPSAEIAITGATTYTYTYAAKAAQTITAENVTATYGDTGKSVSGTTDGDEVLLKQHKILKSKKASVSFLSSANDKIAFEKKLKDMEKIRSKIEELRKNRNIAATRRSKWETTLKELRSLNRTIDCGELRCMDCNSTNIAFSASKKESYAFDVSSTQMRAEIIESIEGKIETYDEEIDRLSSQISEEQDKLQDLMSDDEISLEAIVAYKEKVFSASDAEKRIGEIDGILSELCSRLCSVTDKSEAKKKRQAEVLDSIIECMNEAYHQIDPTGNLQFSDLFTKRDEVFSGSEATIFHLVRLYALKNVLNHNSPIVVDSFRAEDLSTQKEAVVLDLYKSFSNQIILTTTLKNEEMGKYDNMEGINHIDYKTHMPSKLLTAEHVTDFMNLLADLSIPT